MRLILLLLISSTGLYSYGQEKQTIIKVFSGYTTISEESINTSTQTTNYNRTTYDNQGFDLLRSVSIAFQKQNTFHEIEIDKMKFQNERFETKYNGQITTNGHETTTTSIKLRYSYNYIINYAAKMKVIVGLSMAPYFEKEFTKPLVGSYDRVSIYSGLSIELFPRIQYQLTKNFLLECNIPLPLATLLSKKQKTFNPTLTIEQQKNSDSSVSFFDAPSHISLGIGYKF
jgi:hypothetical protein